MDNNDVVLRRHPPHSSSLAFHYIVIYISPQIRGISTQSSLGLIPMFSPTLLSRTQNGIIIDRTDPCPHYSSSFRPYSFWSICLRGKVYMKADYVAR